MRLPLLLLGAGALVSCHGTRAPGESMLRTLAAEPARAARLAPVSTRIAETELQRVPSLDRAAAVAFPTRPVSASDEIVRTGGALLGTATFLGEFDDARHRSAADRDRPEASLWQRLRRRLWL